MQAVSVITTVLNEVQDIPRLIGSLLEQSPPAAEIIVVDGGSTDGTWEWLCEAARRSPSLWPIRDESCSLRFTPGPVSKGRNVAIAAATSELIACVDAGCTYTPQWLALISAPLRTGTAEYALGGACLDLADATLWDIASAPYFGVKMSQATPTKSCTARSMAFTKDLWRRIGGFPENVLLGDDTHFDLEARRLTRPAFVRGAKAVYRPQNTLRSAVRQLSRYGTSDGVLGVRRPRLYRNALRCAAEVLSLVLLPWTWIPLAAVLVLELYHAFRPDWLFPRTLRPDALLARLAFSLMVPWIVAGSHIRGAVTRREPGNTQNERLDAPPPPASDPE